MPEVPPERLELNRWIRLERGRYADVKFAEDTPQRRSLIRTTEVGAYTGGEWEVFTSNYLARIDQLGGLQTAAGRQAAGKAIVTLQHMLETAIMLHGPMPPPGVPSQARAETGM